jgi:hypothetical protein
VGGWSKFMSVGKSSSKVREARVWRVAIGYTERSAG